MQGDPIKWLRSYTKKQEYLQGFISPGHKTRPRSTDACTTSDLLLQHNNWVTSLQRRQEKYGSPVPVCCHGVIVTYCVLEGSAQEVDASLCHTCNKVTAIIFCLTWRQANHRCKRFYDTCGLAVSWIISWNSHKVGNQSRSIGFPLEINLGFFVINTQQ